MNVYTTGRAAKLLNVSIGTVHRWANTGILPTFTLPGGNHRRVLAKDLIAFIVEHKLPIPPELKT